MWREVYLFILARKKWWLLPIMAILLAVGMLVVFAETSVLAPLIYTIF